MKAYRVSPGNKRTWLIRPAGLRRISSGLSIFLLLVLLVGTSCATQGKHRKIKAVPCPCETRNRR